MLHLNLGLGWRELWRPDMLLALTAVFTAYRITLGLGRRLAPGARPLAPGQVWAFAGALLAIYLAEGTPLHVLAEQYLFSAHMLQHVLLTLVLPPLLLLGLPAWLVRPFFQLRPLGRLLAVLLHPLSGFLAFNLVYSLYHWPRFYQLGLQFPLLHLAQHALLTGTALVMWWPVAAPLPEQRLTEGLQILYLFGQGVAQLLVFAMVTYADHVLYPWYGHAPRVMALLSAREDQALAGFVMNAGGLAVFLPALLLAYRRWIQREAARYPLYEDK